MRYKRDGFNLSKVMYQMAFVFLLTLLGQSVQVKAEYQPAEQECVMVHVKYEQTSARKMAEEINDFRTGDEAWAWNETDTSKTVYSGLGEVTYDYGLEWIAMQRAAEIALSYSHTRPDGTDVFSLMDGLYLEYTSAGENIAAGYTSAEAVFEGWKEENEPYSGQGHRRNMLHPDFTHVGIGHAIVGGTHYWVQIFADQEINGDSSCAEDGEMDRPVWITTADAEVSLDYPGGKQIFSVEDGSKLEEPSVKIRMKDTFPDQFVPVRTELYWESDESGVYSLEIESNPHLEYYSQYTDMDICVFTASVYGLKPEEAVIYVSALGQKLAIPLDCKYDLAAMDGKSELVLDEIIRPCTGTEQKVRFHVNYDGRTLEEGRDYTVTWSDNIEEGTARLTVEGIGSYSGSLTDTFRITGSSEFVKFGSCGEETFWAMNKDGTLYFWGDGPIEYKDRYDWRDLDQYVKKVSFEEGITFIPLECCSVFKQCEEIYMADTVKYCDVLAFTYNTALTRVTLSKSLESISHDVFSNCEKLESITLPDSITEIGIMAFRECKNLKTVNIPGQVDLICDWAFEKCKSLERITLPDSLRDIKTGAFIYCSGLKEVRLPRLLKKIEPETFMWCTSLEKIDIPDKVTQIERDAFTGCSSLQTVTFPAGLKYIEEGAFSGCPSIKKVIFKGTMSQWKELAGSFTEFKGATIACSDGEISAQSGKIPVQPDSSVKKSVYVTKIKISGDIHYLARGKRTRLTATIYPSNASNKKVVWKTSNKNLASVDAKGQVLAGKKAGGRWVTITAVSADGHAKASWKIKVMNGVVKKIRLRAPRKTLKVKKTMKLKALVKVTKGKPVNKTLKWTSSNTRYATVTRKGVVKALNAGKGKSVTITARSTDGSNKSAVKKIWIK